MTTWAGIKADFWERFPEFSQAEDETYLDALETAWRFYYRRPYSGNEEIVLNLLAHLLVHEQSSGPDALRPYTSKSADGLSGSFQGTDSATQMDEFFKATKYGQRYLILLGTVPGAYFV